MVVSISLETFTVYEDSIFKHKFDYVKCIFTCIKWNSSVKIFFKQKSKIPNDCDLYSVVILVTLKEITSSKCVTWDWNLEVGIRQIQPTHCHSETQEILSSFLKVTQRKARNAKNRNIVFRAYSQLSFLTHKLFLLTHMFHWWDNKRRGKYSTNHNTRAKINQHIMVRAFLEVDKIWPFFGTMKTRKVKLGDRRFMFKFLHFKEEKSRSGPRQCFKIKEFTT